MATWHRVGTKSVTISVKGGAPAPPPEEQGPSPMPVALLIGGLFLAALKSKGGE